MADVNKVWISGVVVSRPVLTQLSSKTPLTSFNICVNEEFVQNGVPSVRENIVTVESLGKAAEKNLHFVKLGQRYQIDGYLRVDNFDGKNVMRIRTYAIYNDNTSESLVYKKAVSQILDILGKSRDLESAKTTLKEILKT